MSGIRQTEHTKREMNLICRHGAAWVVVLALFVQMLVPFGQALALDVDGDFNYQIICTSTGVKQIPVDANGQPLEPRDATSSCPVCYFHGTAALLVPQSIPVITVINMSVEVDFGVPIQHSPVSVCRIAPNPPRAPPLSA